MNVIDVAKDVPAYQLFVDGQVAKLGRNHPFVKTQYYSEEIDAEGGMFPPARLTLMRGDHAPQTKPQPGRLYAMLLDLAGEDEAITDDLTKGDGDLSNAGRDSTALTVIEVDLSSLADELIKAPTYRVVHRYEWVGVKHTNLYGQVKALAESWTARYLARICRSSSRCAPVISSTPARRPAWARLSAGTSWRGTWMAWAIWWSATPGSKARMQRMLWFDRRRV